MRMLLDQLCRPDAWPAPRPARVELIETHVSWVLRGERDVFKIKKPVALGFLDFRSIERRRAVCEDEVRLNARLAPGVYRGVASIVRRPGGAVGFDLRGDADRRERADPRRPGGVVAFDAIEDEARSASPRAGGTPSAVERGFGRDGEIVDWAVHMARLDDAFRADALLAAGRLSGAHLDTIARTIADLHARSVVTPLRAAHFASPAAIGRNVRENFAQIGGRARDVVDGRAAREVEERQTAFVRDRAALFDARLPDRVCDGHGDLRLEHVYFAHEGLRIIDCIEFDERYRIGDGCADVAFLAMDLSSQGHSDRAEQFLARYARAAQDYDLYALVDFYEGYRAWIRGKVALMLAGDAGVDESDRARACAVARRHFLLAQACERGPLISPALVCVGGIIASGKSTVADALADELSCPVVDSDRTRTYLLRRSDHGVGREPAWEGAYDSAATDRVYAEILRRASIVLSSGRSVIVDASFRTSAMRRRVRDLARDHGAVFRFGHCTAPVELCRDRLARRRGGPSGAHPAMFDAFAASFEPVSELPVSEVIGLDTTAPVARSVDLLRDSVV